ncbi:DUF2510 domain-containing protein, partial [Streptomyces sp. NPDC057695]|uniref:DUF2510 domain-containing protein n=1 Tax=Streptomyces sp. NPDC057695 TaxID=3346217 RepID=UPI0036CC1BA7
MATPPGGGEEVPQAGYYPDPSIPGYIRFWNGGAWVPGTSRPAPTDGEVPPGPPASAIPAGPILASGPAPAPAAQPARPAPEPARQQPERHLPQRYEEPQRHQDPQPHHEPQRPPVQQQPQQQQSQPRQQPQPAPPAPAVPAQDRGPAPLPAQDRAPALAPVPAVEETGPFFFDEEPAPAEPASAWQADTSRQTGFGGDLDRKVSWGAPPAPDPRTPADWPVAGAGEPEPESPARAAAPAADLRPTGGAARLGGMPVTPVPAPAPQPAPTAHPAPRAPEPRP